MLAAIIALVLGVAGEDQKGAVGVRWAKLGNCKAKTNEREESDKDGELHVVRRVVE